MNKRGLKRVYLVIQSLAIGLVFLFQEKNSTSTLGFSMYHVAVTNIKSEDVKSTLHQIRPRFRISTNQKTSLKCRKKRRLSIQA